VLIDSCAFEIEISLPNFRSSEHSPYYEVHVSYTVEVCKYHTK